MSEEEKEAIEYLENRLDILHNNTQWATEKSIKVVLNLIEKQQREIEEKSTIIMAGAEKVKQLEKGNRSLMESRIKWKSRYYKEKAKNKECISKDKIREIISEYRKQLESADTERTAIMLSNFIMALNDLLEEN